MANRLQFFDGAKSYSVLDDTPGLWTYFSNAPRQEIDVLYAKVSAVFRAFNLKANTVGNMPFVLTKLGSGEEYDSSATWENKVKVMPNPSELFRLDTLSYMATNTVYNLLTKSVVGRDKELSNRIPSAFTPVTHAITGNLDYVERRIGLSGVEKYAPDGKLIGGGPTSPRLIRMWRLDHTTEVLPSPNTEAQAIVNAAGIIYHADTWIQNFFARGGVVPMIIAMKGMVGRDTKEEEEKSWTKWYRGLGDRFNRIFRVTNADAMEVKQVGSGIEQLKDNVTYRQAIENIAMATGMPLSLLLANSANYATAKEEKATWYENDIVPLCNWLAYGYNEQVFHPLKLHLEFHPETLDPNQEDETERATAINTFMDFLNKCPTFEVFIGTAETFGYELSDGLVAAAQKYYADKARRAEETRLQMQGAGVLLGPDGKPIRQRAGDGGSEVVRVDEKPAEEPEEDEEEVEEEKATLKAAETSAMIALRIPDAIRQEIAARYPFVDADTLNDLHITLIYLGDSRTLNKIDMIRAASAFAECQAPIKGTLQGLARFVSGGEQDPLVVTFDSPQMPHVYTALASCLEMHRIPYHREHGFIPHMTLAYIPADADMPIETIEPIELNFNEVYLVDGDQWFSVTLTGYENKGSQVWLPSLDELEEMRVWREVALRKHKKGESLDFDYEYHYGGVNADFAAQIKARLAQAATAEEVRAAFVVDTTTPAPVKVETLTVEPDPAILALAESINKLALATIEAKGN